MKGSHWFIIFIVAFLVIMFAVEYHLPKKFVWTPTFGHYDDQPFGCAVFDSLLSASLPLSLIHIYKQVGAVGKPVFVEKVKKLL